MSNASLQAFKYGRFTHPADAYRKAEDGGDEYTMDDVVNTVLAKDHWRFQFAGWLKRVGVDVSVIAAGVPHG